MSPRVLLCSQTLPRPLTSTLVRTLLLIVAETRQLCPVCFPGSMCAALQALEKLCSNKWVGSMISATSHHFLWAGQVTLHRGRGRAQGEYKLSATPSVEQLPWSFQPPGWLSVWDSQSWLAQWAFYTKLFYFSSQLLQKSRELPCSEEGMLWGDARKQHWPEQVGASWFTVCSGEGEETSEWLLPKKWPQDGTARMRHAPVHKLAFYLL